jgi:tetratricopeptide (TPR) repeat protein
MRKINFILVTTCFLVLLLTFSPSFAFVSFRQRQEIRNLQRSAELDINAQLYGEAIDKYNKILSLGGKPRQIKWRLAEVHFQAGQYFSAIEKCQWCLEQKNSSAQKRKIYQLLGRSYFELGRYAEAIGIFREALNVFSKDGSLHYWLSLVYYKSDLFNEAFKECEKAIETGLANSELWLLAGDIATRKYLLDNAAQYYQKVEGEETKEAKYKLGQIFLRQRKFKQAREMFEGILKIDADSAPACFGIGESYFKENRFVQAEQFFHRALELDINLIQPQIGLVIIYLERGDYKKAEEILNQNRQSGVESKANYFLKGLIYYYQGEIPRAERTFKKIIRTEQNDLITQLSRELLQVIGE